MSMRLSVFRSLFVVCIALGAAGIAVAQDQTDDKEMTVNYGVGQSDFFSYQITFNTTAKRYLPHSDVADAYTRRLTYYFSEQIDSVGNDGIVSISANVDSIRIDAKRGPKETAFDSQNDSMLSVVDLRDPELIGTTMILNKRFRYRMTLDGDFIDYTGWDMWFAMIDTTNLLDTATKFADEEYMRANFVRTLVLASAGFQYGRQYRDLQHWKQAMPRLVFKTPVIDSADCHIEISPSHKEEAAFFDGKLYIDTEQKRIREHGFADTSVVDSLSGVSRDTMMLNGHGFVRFRGNTSRMRMYLHSGKLHYTEAVDERIEMNLLEYEKR